jgi:hypothetical protein
MSMTTGMQNMDQATGREEERRKGERGWEGNINAGSSLKWRSLLVGRRDQLPRKATKQVQNIKFRKVEPPSPDSLLRRTPVSDGRKLRVSIIQRCSYHSSQAKEYTRNGSVDRIVETSKDQGR